MSESQSSDEEIEQQQSKHLKNQPKDKDFELKAFVDADPESKQWKNR